MIVQGLNTLFAAYGAAAPQASTRQPAAAPTANLADKVTISSAARTLAAAQPADDSAVESRLNAIKAKPGGERTAADTAFLLENDKRLAEITTKDPQTLTSDEIDYMQKASGFVNTMANLTTKEKALYDELIAAGNTAATEAINMIALSRQGMQGQQIMLANGTSFDPTVTEITADNVRNLFKYLIVDSDGSAARQFEALASYLEKRDTAASA